ncbi:mucin-17 isoform X2 [Drosophila kikkawai]|uniref:Mucin-17 isoform X2 n=1 Tax=Drosophila kikkawai TaxID=30033 RepID=A0A6P4IK40_DROKI|nr:mucin-5AC isoform X3 [Drosophila kikkawai]
MVSYRYIYLKPCKCNSVNVSSVIPPWNISFPFSCRPTKSRFLVLSKIFNLEKCKRRWRQLRNDYTRWLNADASRRRLGQRRFPYSLADDFSFLDPHLNLADEERSGSERDRDSNRDSESRDNTTASLKGDAARDDKSVNEESLVAQLLGEEDPSTKDSENDKPKEKPKQEKPIKKSAQEKSVEKELDEVEEPQKSLEEDSFLQSDQEGDEPIEEEHLEQLDDFEFGEEEELMQEKEKDSSENTEDSPASQSEFFIKQNKEPHLLIIGKKNSTLSSGEAPEAEADDLNQGDPLEDSMEESIDETAAKTLSRRDSAQSPSRRLRRIKTVPLKKPTQVPRVTRFQRTKVMTMAAAQSMRSSTSPVKLTPVPRPGGTKSVQVKPSSVPLKDGLFSRPEMPSGEGKQGANRQGLTPSQSQRPPVMRRLTTTGSSRPGMITSGHDTPPKRGRPPKVMHRLVGRPIRKPSPSTPKVLPINKPSSPTVTPGTNMAHKASNPATNTPGNLTKRVPNPTATTATIVKPLENLSVRNYSPISSTDSSPGISKSSLSGVATTSTNVASTNSVATKTPSLLKRCERTTQTDSPDIFSDEHFLDMIKPQMKEMNPRQKMHFKKKVFQALMETFDDATDFPEAGELQHFNINTPSGFEHVTSPELRLIRELVSLVSAAKVSARGQPLPQAKPSSQAPPLKEGFSYAAVPSSDSPRGLQTLSIPRHLVQRVYKPSPGAESTPNSAAAPGGGEKKMYRFLQSTNGKPNGKISASLEDLRKDSVDSDRSMVSSTNVPPASPKGATVVAAVRPQGSTMNSLFGSSGNVTAVRAGPSLKARAMARRYSTCNNQITNSIPISQTLGYPSSLNTNLTPMEANALKRRLMGAAQPMVPPTQRPRYSGGPGVQQIVTPQGNSLLVRRPAGPSPGAQKQQLSPTGGVVLTPQKTPQITNVQGAAFKDFVQPKPTSAASPASSASSTSSASPAAGEGTPQSMALKRSLVVANAKNSLLVEKPVNKPQQQQQQPQVQKTNPRYSSMTAATIAADDFSLASLKREPVDHMDDHDDILGM